MHSRKPVRFTLPVWYPLQKRLAHSRPVGSRECRPILCWIGRVTTLPKEAWLVSRPKITSCLTRAAGIPQCVEPWRKQIAKQLLPLARQLLMASRSGPRACATPFRESGIRADDSFVGFLDGPTRAVTGDDSDIAIVRTDFLVREVP